MHRGPASGGDSLRERPVPGSCRTQHLRSVTLLRQGMAARVCRSGNAPCKPHWLDWKTSGRCTKNPLVDQTLQQHSLQLEKAPLAGDVRTVHRWASLHYACRQIYLENLNPRHDTFAPEAKHKKWREVFPSSKGRKRSGHIPDKKQAGKCDVPMWVFTVSVLVFRPENGRSFSAFNLCSQKIDPCTSQNLS